MRSAATLILAVSMAAHLGAIEIQIDYSLDTGNFFNTDEKRAAMEAAAGFFGDMIDDNLLSINNTEFPSGNTWTADFTDPTTGGLESVENLVVPEDVIIIYVGARELSGSTVGLASTGGYSISYNQLAWLDRVRERGQTGASDSPATDTSTWGGSIAFDTSVTWNFSQTSNGAGVEFMNTALHEIAHILGIGIPDSQGTNLWESLTSGSTFTGVAATRSNGNVPPGVDEDKGHFSAGLNSSHFESFGVSHGSSAPVLMQALATDTGLNFDVATDLDLAALGDLGWDVNPDPGVEASALSPSGVTLNWNSVSFKEYAIERATVLPSFSTVRALADGDGDVQSWSDPSPPSGKAFYRLIDSTIPAVGGASVEARLSEASVDDGQIYTIYREPVDVECKSH